MSKRTILFRADGGSSIGMGHFTRTLALAKKLNNEFLGAWAVKLTPVNNWIVCL